MFANKRMLIILMIAVLALPALAILPSAGAQVGPKPEAVGLRPDAPPYALHGPYWVGTREFVIDEGSDYPIPVVVWYPALNPDGRPENTEYLANVSMFAEVPDDLRQAVQGHALDNANPDMTNAPYPLVIFSHGMGSLTPVMWAHLTEHMASWGFVVIAPKHLRDVDPFYLATILRLLEVRRTIAYADTLTSAGGAFENAIDTEHIAVMGHSGGGIISYGAGGAALNWSAIEEYCQEYPEDPNCTDLTGQKSAALDAIGLDTEPTGLWPAMWDPRVDAILPMSGTIEMYGKAGLASVTIPMMVLTGSGDTIAIPEWVLPSYESVSSVQKAMVVFENGWHTLFIDKCESMPWVVDLGFGVFCSDSVWDMDRAHDLTYHFVTAFLLTTLKGDTEAAVALAPDAVSFPGITYEAQGF